MSAPSLTVTSPLTIRLLKRILFLSLLLILAIAGGRAWWEYHAAQEATVQLMHDIERSASRSLARSLWEVDAQHVATHLDGIRNAPGINYAAVLDGDRVMAEDGVRKAHEVLTHIVPLKYLHEGREILVGTLVLQADLDLARQRAFSAMFLSLSINSALVLLVALAVFVLTRSMVSRHLAAAAEHFQTLRIGPPDLDLQKLHLDKRIAGDELDILCLAVNHMQDTLTQAYGNVSKAEHEARSQARFPEENPNPVLRVGADGTLLYANESSQGFMAHMDCTPGQPLPGVYRGIIREALATGQVQQFEAEYGGRAFAFVARPIRAEGCVNLYGMDITERKLAADEVQRSLSEKEILLKEIHHRVKNNMQVISSLLFLQMEYVSDPRDKELFSESQKRIQAMALVHEELYGAKDLSLVDMREYIPRLVNRAMASTVIPVHQECLVDAVRLPVTRCVPFGLALNELVMNAAKHAFRPGASAEGLLRVELRRNGSELVLTVEDNGPGLPPDYDFEDTPTLGMTLVSSLTQQLNGRMTTRNLNPGACFEITFPMEES